ncbi:hypothetical protein AAMO2058_001244500, partial [Amorphochlora amoebiformis]
IRRVRRSGWKTLSMFSGRVVRYGLGLGGVFASIWGVYKLAQLRRERKASVRICIVGDIFMDIVVGGLRSMPVWGGDVVTETPMSIMPGGGGLNSAIQIARLQQREKSDAQIELHSLLGSDYFGKVIRHRLKAAGVKLMAPTVNVGTGSCICLSGARDSKSDRGFVSFRGAMALFSTNHLNENHILNSSHVHIGGYYNFPNLWDGLADLLTKLRRRNITTSLNPQWDASGLWSGLDSLYCLLEFVIINQDEAFHLTKHNVLSDALLFLHNKGLKMAVVTIGSRGAVASIACDEKDSKTLWFWAKAKKVKPVDTTGGGDAFSGGFLHYWTKTRNVSVALRNGCALGTAMVTKLGASVEVTAQEIQNVLPETCEKGIGLSDSPLKDIYLTNT